MATRWKLVAPVSLVLVLLLPACQGEEAASGEKAPPPPPPGQPTGPVEIPTGLTGVLPSKSEVVACGPGPAYDSVKKKMPAGTPGADTTVITVSLQGKRLTVTPPVVRGTHGDSVKWNADASVGDWSVLFYKTGSTPLDNGESVVPSAVGAPGKTVGRKIGAGSKCGKFGYTVTAKGPSATKPSTWVVDPEVWVF